MNKEEVLFVLKKYCLLSGSQYIFYILNRNHFLILKGFLDSIDTDNKVPHLLSTIYPNDICFNEFFFLVCSICLLPFRYLCQCILIILYSNISILLFITSSRIRCF